ncbi:MAG: TRAP transporter permease [Candidatus Atribacteria bacterium]|nr:TRAP transporter permease [Candidatus Atribacteria bacterium]
MNKNLIEMEANTRILNGTIALYATILGVFISLLHIWMNSYGLTIVIERNIIHVSLFMSLAFLYYPATSRSRKDGPSLLDWVFSIWMLVIAIYFPLSYSRLIKSLLSPNLMDYIYGISLMILVIEASRRVVGLPLTLLSIGFLVYAYFGPYFPEPFSHQGFNFRRIMIRMTMTDEGIPGIAVMVSSSYVFMFILFANFLKVSGASQFFNDFATALAGSKRGGPAKIAVIASAMTGTISGSSQANVVTTGSFTIPLMKEIGYKAHFAGAVEAIASTGGILMPPVMGAAAFIMSSFLGIPYLKIMYAGFIPAILFYYTLYHMVDLGALKWNLTSLPKEKLPKIKEIIKKKGHMAVPLIILVTLIVMGFSPLIASLVSNVLIIVVGYIRKETRLSPKDIIIALDMSAKGAISIAVVCAVVGYVIAVVSMTGIGQTVGQNILGFSGGRLLPTLVLCMLTAIILGMGLPAAACYIITVTVAAPALLMLGIDPLIAHFFAFYYGTMSAVIPPVALTSYTAAAIAKSQPTKVALTGFGLGVAGFLLPFMFVYHPVLLLINFSWSSFIYEIVSALVALYSLSVAVIGFLRVRLSIYERILFFIASIAIISGVLYVRIFGFALFGIYYFIHINKFGKKVDAQRYDH